MAIAAIVVLILAGGWVKNGSGTPTQSLWMMGSAMALGLLVVVGYVELIVGRALGFKSATWAIGAGLAIVGYVCHVEAAQAVNGIFHVDVSALPLTVAAGTALLMFAFFKWAMLCACAVSATILIVLSFDILHRDTPTEAVSNFCAAIAATLFSGFAFVVAYNQLSDDMLRSKLYRVAHDTDFSAFYDCVGHDPKRFDALFIGPDQRRALFAPKLDDEELQERINGRAAIMLPVEIPEAFEVADCTAPPWPRAASDSENN